VTSTNIITNSSRRPGRPFFSDIDNADYARLDALFPDLAQLESTRFLALRPFLDRCPERFFDRHAFSLFLNWLKRRDASDRGSLKAYFSEKGPEVDAALHSLRQINAEGWHDDAIKSGDEYSGMRLADRTVHPAYLRLSEGVLAPLIRPLAHFSRLDRGKGIDRLDIFNLAEELSKTPFSDCTKHYDHIVRNGIGHGTIAYLHDGIRYQDKKGGSKILSVRNLVRLFDDLLDTCNGLAAALKVFFLTHAHHGYALPRELLIEELQENTHSPWWSIEGCLESEIPKGKQLLIYARPSSRDLFKVYWSAIHTAMVAETLTSGYQRYFVSLVSPRQSLGWAAFDGEKISEIRRSGADQAHHYISAFEDIGFFFSVKPKLPRFLARIETFIGFFRANAHLTRERVRAAILFPKIVCRDATIHRNAWGYVLNGNVVISSLGDEPLSNLIRTHRRRIIRKAAATGKASTSRLDPARYLPLGFARISVYCEDFRRRRFDGFGLERQLVCTIQLKRIRRIRTIDILGSTVEASGNWRIAWNKAWIENDCNG
jgi:hypothetical protein